MHTHNNKFKQSKRGCDKKEISLPLFSVLLPRGSHSQKLLVEFPRALLRLHIHILPYPLKHTPEAHYGGLGFFLLIFSFFSFRSLALNSAAASTLFSDMVPGPGLAGSRGPGAGTEGPWTAEGGRGRNLAR